MASITNPEGDDSLVPTGAPILFEADASVDWYVAVNDAAYPGIPNASGVSRFVYNSPTSVLNRQSGVHGDAAVDKVSVQIRIGAGVQDTTTLLLVEGVPAINPTGVACGCTERVAEAAFNLDCTSASTPGTSGCGPGTGCFAGVGGPADPTAPTSTLLMDKDNAPKAACTGGITLTDSVPGGGGGCGCSGVRGGGGGASVGTLTGESAGLVRPQAVFSPLETAALSSRIAATPYGVVQVRSGCGGLHGRGGRTIDLGVYYTNKTDGVTSRRPAGAKRMFGWQVKLVPMSVSPGHAALYRGDRTVEGWRSDDGGSTFTAARGVFGTLVKNGDGTYTRTMKDGTVYDFDSSGKLQKIRDRSQDGNVVYYDYSGDDVIRIQGPGMGYRAYFTYNAASRVNGMSLEAPGNPSRNRTTYYDYDDSDRMDTVLGPELCLTYFENDASLDTLKWEIDPDNYRTYFTYEGDRIREVNLSEGAAVYFTYDSTVPRSTRGQAGGPTISRDYQWAGLPHRQERSGGSERSYFLYDRNAKPRYIEGTDGEKTYYTWDGSGQMQLAEFPDRTNQYFVYGTFGRMTHRRDELGEFEYWAYDAYGNQARWEDALGKSTYFEYTSSGEIVSVKDRRGNVTYYTWDSRGNHTSTKWADLGVRYYDYNPAGEAEVLIDEGGDVSYFDHDQRGRIVKWKDPLAQATEYAFDNRSNLTLTKDRRGFNWYFRYDGLSRQTVRQTPEGNASYFNYNRENTLANAIDPRGKASYFYYDALKRPQATENALAERSYFTYTAAGQVESVKDPRGNAVYYTYDSRHRRTSEKDGVGNVTYSRYDAVGNLSAQTDPRANTTYHYYDALDRRTATRNPLFELNYYYYDVEGNQTTQEDALQRRSYFYYDSRDRRFAAEDPQKNLSYFTYEARSLQSSQKDARGNVTYFYQDKLSRQFAVRDARNGVTYTEYDAEGSVASTKDARGNLAGYGYDKDRRRQSMTDALGNLTYWFFDAASNTTAIRDPRLNHAYFYYDSVNRQFAQEDAKRALTYHAYDAAGNRISTKDPLGRVGYFYYDGANRNFSVENPLRGLRYFTYDGSSNQNSVKDERGNVTYHSFDALDRNFRIVSAVGGSTSFTFDAVGNRKSVFDPLGRLGYFYYDTLNRLEASEDGLQKRTYYAYDPVGNTLSVKNPRREGVSPSEVGIQYFTYDEVNRKSSMKDEVAQAWYFDYDLASNRTVQTNPRGALTYWEYDVLNRKQSQKDPLGRAWYWTYDPAGNVNSLKDGKAQVTYYQVDAVNLQDRIDYPDATQHYYEHDLARQRTAAADPGGRTTFGYDTLGRMTSRTNPGGQSLYYEYDPASNRNLLRDPDGFVVYYDYDAANRLTSSKSGYGQQPYGISPYGGWAIAIWEYNLADQVVHERPANGTVSYWGYDAAARTSLIQHRKSDGTLIEQYDYTRDEAGNITYQLRGSDSMRTYWNYDQANRVTKEAWRTSAGADVYGFEYAYDPAGNRLSKRSVLQSATTYWEYDLGDQMTLQRSGAPVTVYFTFDSNGNLSVEHDTDASAGRTYYDYEPRNLLSRVDFPGAIATNYFEYNAFGERTRKDDSTGGKKYTWDGIDVVAEKNLSNITTQRLVKGFAPIGGIGSYVSQVLSKIIYPHKNQVGTTMRHTDGTQVVVNTYEYDAWGQPLVTTQGTAQQFRFTGKELDPDFLDFNSSNRRYHFPARAYLPFRGGFVQADPFMSLLAPYSPGAADRLLLYVYVNHSPVNHLDPYGLVCCVADFEVNEKGTSEAPGAVANAITNGKLGFFYWPVNMSMAGGKIQGMDQLCYGFDLIIKLTEDSDSKDCDVKRHVEYAYRSVEFVTGDPNPKVSQKWDFADPMNPNLNDYKKTRIVLYDCPGVTLPWMSKPAVLTVDVLHHYKVTVKNKIGVMKDSAYIKYIFKLWYNKAINESKGGGVQETEKKTNPV